MRRYMTTLVGIGLTIGCGNSRKASHCRGQDCVQRERGASASVVGRVEDPPYRFLSRDGIGTGEKALQYYRGIAPQFVAGQAAYSLAQWQADTFGAPLQACQGARADSRLLLDFSFDNGTSEGFVYRGDIFRNTDQQNYNSGRVVDGAGALQVILGGRDDQVVQGMSGGWEGSLFLQRETRVQLRLTFSLTISRTLEPDEFAQLLATIDDRLIIVDDRDFLFELGGQTADRDVSSGLRTVEVEIDRLSAGSHTLAVGAHLNRKSTEDELVELLIDRVQVVDQDGGSCRLPDGSLADERCCRLVSGFYRNALDLGFWREMVCTEEISPGAGGCMVRNWADEDDPQREVADLGTVAMDIDPLGFTRFYAFAPGGADLSPAAVLDAEGEKFLPQICTTCHGGKFDGINPDLGAVFREFEPSLLESRSGVAQQQAEQEWYDLNQAIRSANRALRGDREDVARAAQAVNEYVDQIYVVDDPPVSRGIDAPEHIPASWGVGDNTALGGAKRALWSTFVGPYCMGCHRVNSRDWSDYGAFAALATEVEGVPLIKRYISPDEADPDRAERSFMPQAELMFQSLHRDRGALAALDDWLALVGGGVVAGAGEDTTPPQPAIKDPLDGAEVASALTVMVVASDDDEIRELAVFIDGSPLLAQQYADLPYQFELFRLQGIPAGLHTLTVVATDGAGNRGETSVVMRVSSAASAASQTFGASSLGGGGHSATGDAERVRVTGCQATSDPPDGIGLLLLCLVLLLHGWGRRRRQSSSATALVCVAILTIASLFADTRLVAAKANGVPGYSGLTDALRCTSCHSAAGSLSALTILGPAQLAQAETGIFEVELVPSSNAIRASGIDVASSGGSLRSQAGDTTIKSSGPDLIHVQPKQSDPFRWRFEWTAPEQEGLQTIYVAAIGANLDQTPVGDEWGRNALVVEVGVAASVPNDQPALPTGNALHQPMPSLGGAPGGNVAPPLNAPPPNPSPRTGGTIGSEVASAETRPTRITGGCSVGRHTPSVVDGTSALAAMLLLGALRRICGAAGGTA